MLIAFLVIGIGLSGCSGDKIEKFTDSTGVEWRVLTTDKDGNKLIITEHIHGTKHIEDLGLQGVQYNNKNTYTRLNDSDGLKPALKQWFAKNLSLELKERALPVENMDNDVRKELNTVEDSSEEHMAIYDENEQEGWTTAGSGIATPENSIFVLSISEVNQYESLGTLNIQNVQYKVENPNPYILAYWWLRSPGSGTDTVAIMSEADTTREAIFTSVSATAKIGFRPALWISPSK